MRIGGTFNLTSTKIPRMIFSQGFVDEPRYRKAAAADAWDKLLAFFDGELT